MNDTVATGNYARTAPGSAVNYLPFVGRLMIAAIFLLSAFGKIAAPGATIGYIGFSGLPFPSLAYAGAIIIEAGGGLALLAGYKTRPAALVLAGFALLTAFAFHYALGDQNQFIHFFKNVAIAGGLLQIAAFGPGAVSVDRD